MLKTNISLSLIEQNFERYVDLIGYCHILSKGGPGLIDGRKVKFSSRLILSDYKSLPKFDDVYKIPKIIMVEQWSNHIVEKLMNKHRLDVALIHMIANLRKHNTSVETRSILKVELLDERGKVMDAIHVDESAVPKEWRNKI